MKVILLQDIDKIGKKYEVKHVTDGHARNFLLPKGLAKPATEENLVWLETQKEEIRKKSEGELEETQKLASSLDGLEIIIPVKIGENAVSPQIIYNIMGFYTLYLGVFVVGVLLLTFVGTDLITALGASAACIGNIGPGLGEVGPAGTFAAIPAIGKIFLSISMLLGRLELYTVLVIFSRSFWKV